ncbi:protein kinase domain-containing protein [Ditylenchus destructor]|nr:protein kinase domain-containing protein [Ditylenchus destructor]
MDDYTTDQSKVEETSVKNISIRPNLSESASTSYVKPSHNNRSPSSSSRRKCREDRNDSRRHSDNYSSSDVYGRHYSSHRNHHEKYSHRRHSPEKYGHSTASHNRHSAEKRDAIRVHHHPFKVKMGDKYENTLENFQPSSSESSARKTCKNSPPFISADELKAGQMELSPIEMSEVKGTMYSKFESSPERDDTSENESYEDEKMWNTSSMQFDEGDSSSIERKEFYELTEEEKELIAPETLQELELRYQNKLISQLPVYFPGIFGCRNVAEFECLNHIEEGAYGVVYRAIEKKTDEIVALKRLKMEKERDGFPITSLREINMLLKCGKHPNVVNVREIVEGGNMDKIYLVMEYVEHDMKTLMESLKSKNKKFTPAQVKSLMRQLLSGIEFMHNEFVIHRDLKTSNLLLSHSGVLKIGDFGLAREFGNPLKPYTPIVVTLWYRSPELLLGIKEYSTAVDMWSVGCIFAEFMKLKPLFMGKSEIDQLQKIFMEIGTPNEHVWPGYSELPGVKLFALPHTPYNQLRNKFASNLSSGAGFELLNRLLAPCPINRITASEALKSSWFAEHPLPTPPEEFPTWPAKSEHNKKRASTTFSGQMFHKPNATKRTAEELKMLSELGINNARHVHKTEFSLKADVQMF